MSKPPPHGATTGKQEQKRAIARNRICRAVTECLVEHGYADTSINRVVERAGVSKGALRLLSRYVRQHAGIREIDKRGIASVMREIAARRSASSIAGANASALTVEASGKSSCACALIRR